MIVGDGGVIFVDAGSEPADTAAALVGFREISDAPVAALIYTHGHGHNDHTSVRHSRHAVSRCAGLGGEIRQTHPADSSVRDDRARTIPQTIQWSARCVDSGRTDRRRGAGRC
jgi:glyoxylase-like metal-dependent hydrolase (beta-lactamase superfamily II)